YGRVGGIVGKELAAAGVPFRVIDDNDERVAQLKAEGVAAFGGNAAAAEVLAQGDLQAARAVIVAIPDAFEAGQVVEQA
ncbi:NAD-binding protein, partial [Mycobacterium tuberculosis]|nr:NAD-binding protein [Mycobacterium tuberculosis]